MRSGVRAVLINLLQLWALSPSSLALGRYVGLSLFRDNPEITSILAQGAYNEVAL